MNSPEFGCSAAAPTVVSSLLLQLASPTAPFLPLLLVASTRASLTQTSGCRNSVPLARERENLSSHFSAGLLSSTGFPKDPCHCKTATHMLSSSSRLPSVLLVDDDADSRALTLRLLAKGGIENPVVELPGGEEAKSYLRSCCLAAGAPRGIKPAVVLLDLNMPVVSGFSFLRWLRKKKAFRDLKVIVLSTSEEEEDRDTARQLKADAYLVKFPHAAVLGATVRACLGAHRLNSGASKPPPALCR